MQEKNKKSLLRATMVRKKFEKNFKKTLDSSLIVYYTVSELRREGNKKVAREKLKKYRISIGKTQKQMAEIWGITLSFYKKIEAGKKNPSIQNLKEFKKRFFNANTDEIFLS